MSQLCELGGSVIDRAPIKGYPTSSMNLEELESISSQTASPEEVHHSLEEFRAIDLKNRESNFETIHEKFIQPFYRQGKRCDFQGSRDVKLSARNWLHGNADSTLLVIGGRNESHAKYAEVAYDFFSRGFDVWTYDHRGQGFSQRELRNTQIGWVESFQNYVNDLDIFYNRIVLPQKRKNFFIVAHSMGAAVTALWLAQSQVKPTAVMLTAPMIDLILKPYPRFVVALMVAAGLRSGRDKQYVPGSQDFQFSDYGFDLTNSTARRNWNRDLFVHYPALRLGGPSFQWLHEALQVPRRLRAAKFPASVDCPVLVFQAGSDQVVKPNAQIHLRSKNPHFVMAYEPHGQHELLQEQDDIRARVINKTLQFFEKATLRGENM